MSREAASEALLAIITGAYAWGTPPSRRLVLWSDCPPSNRPTAFLFEGGTENYVWGAQNVNPKRTAEIKLFIYIDAKDPSAVGATQLNNIFDAIDAALVPSGADIVRGRLTGGGTAHQFRIEGAPFKDPGDIDGDGIMIIPIKIIRP